MRCWSVELVVFFSTLDYQILSSPYLIVSVSHRLRIIHLRIIYICMDLRLQNEMF